MNILNFLFGKKQVINQQQNKELITNISSLTKPIANEFVIHQDIVNLLWIADGPHKNYINAKKQDIFEMGGINIIFSSMSQDEPSLINTALPISNIDDVTRVEKLPYYPTYIQLTPEQRGVYLKLLANPYNNSIDIGFVFILYYGLERHLLNGDYEQAFNVILKLRDVHNNNSFQHYSGNALVLTCLCKQRADLAYTFMTSLDKDFEYNFSGNLFLLCKFSLNIPVTPKDIMRLAKSFEFDNLNYIKNQPEIFENFLLNNIQDKYNSDSILIKDLIKETEYKKLRKQSTNIFANISIIDKTVDIPTITECFKFKKALYDLLDVTHVQVKSKVAELKKNGLLETKEKIVKPVVILTFDEHTEKELLQGLNKCKPNSLDKHFALISLQNFYYKYRTIDDKYLEKCINYCELDINSLDDMQKSYYLEECNNVKKLSNIYSKREILKELSEVTSFNGNITAFKRLAIIFEKQKKYTDSIAICQKAIDYYKKINMVDAVNEFEARKSKLLEKIK